MVGLVLRRTNSPYIVLHLRGGLGNQLFQATAAAYLASKFETTVVLDDSNIIRHIEKSRRSWLRKIDLNALYKTDKLIWRNKILSKLNLSAISLKDNQLALDEVDLKGLTEVTEKIHIADWFQNSTYAQLLMPKFVSDRGIRLRRSVRIQVNKIENTEDLGAIHVRLGDFRETPWGILSEDWYRGALVKMIEVKKLKRIDCYSDEIETARKMLTPLNRQIEIRFPEERYALLPHELLWTMSKYNSFVSSNSSLSWWSSYLNQNNRPLVFCNWGNNLFLKNWHKISVYGE